MSPAPVITAQSSVTRLVDLLNQAIQTAVWKQDILAWTNFKAIQNWFFVWLQGVLLKDAIKVFCSDIK